MDKGEGKLDMSGGSCEYGGDAQGIGLMARLHANVVAIVRIRITLALSLTWES